MRRFARKDASGGPASAQHYDLKVRASRRQFTRTLASPGRALAFQRWLGAQVLAVPPGRLESTVPLGRFDGRPAPPLNVLLGTGLDARQFTDLSAIDATTPVMPVEHFYIRTSHPPELPTNQAWRCILGGLVANTQSLDLPTLEREARDTGTHLMECAGNSDPANFGLISAASWSGVTIGAVLDRLGNLPNAWRVMVTGIDDQRRPSVTSNPGAA